jgi:hypothetical protein
MTAKRLRTGPRMVDVLRYVNANPGCTNQAVACAVGPNGSHAYGDRIVKRCYRRCGGAVRCLLRTCHR